MLEVVATAKDGALGDALQYIWEDDVLSRRIRLDLTVDAMKRMDAEARQALGVALHAKSPDDPWLEEHLPAPPKKKDGTTCNAITEPPKNLTFGTWYQADTFAECRLCRFRPVEKPFLQYGMRFLQATLQRAYYCKFCRYWTLKLGLVSDPVPVESETKEPGHTSTADNKLEKANRHDKEAIRNTRDEGISEEGPSARVNGTN
ncbi:hypothetical protein PSACC_00099 [Paramicrosporidium saccamoebae]|uniref:Uncharacterized protein n=2 Tax=Paramicrosporidium saccamoebae TaxID=1246581 RepID=A0A2H9TQQ8_9FUNG|nr:hypothetical protein PSACC_00099 [Paramicrosporidium saccamoebae]